MRVMSLACCLLFGLSLVLYLENRAVRRDQNAMAEAYSGFLARKLGKKPLTEAIKPGSMAVWQAGPNFVGCVIFTGKPGGL